MCNVADQLLNIESRCRQISFKNFYYYIIGPTFRPQEEFFGRLHLGKGAHLDRFCALVPDSEMATSTGNYITLFLPEDRCKKEQKREHLQKVSLRIPACFISKNLPSKIIKTGISCHFHGNEYVNKNYNLKPTGIKKA
jgi:hypothetical protein